MSRTGVEHEVERALADTLPQVDLREAQVVGRGGDEMLVVVIDHPDGVTHELCAAVTRELDRAGLRDRYGIEVSSPGPEPPLRTEEHYREAIGGRVALKVASGEGVRARNVTGTLIGVTDAGVELDAGDGARQIGWNEIRRGRVIGRSEG